MHTVWQEVLPRFLVDACRTDFFEKDVTRLWDRLQNIQKGPHPGPLPSDGRGRNVVRFVV